MVIKVSSPAYDARFKALLEAEAQHFITVLNQDAVKVNALVADVMALPRPPSGPPADREAEVDAALYAMKRMAWHIHLQMNGSE